MKKMFAIEEPYRFEWGDVRALIQIVNVALIMIYGLIVSWFGLAIAVFDTVQDLRNHRHINTLLIHLSLVALNIYFLTILYK